MKIPPWTASSIDAFITCPYKFYRLRVLRDVKDLPPSEQSLWGRRVHKVFEDAVNWGDPLSEEYKQWQPLVDKIKALPGEKLPEFRFSIDQDFNQCPWKDAWSRGMADLVVRNGKEAIILDYKTGKRKPSDQLQLYAGFAFAYWPHLERVHTAFVWLKDKVLDRKTYEAKDKADIWANWMPLYKRYERAFETDVWMKHPSGLCRNWCPCKDCEFCGV